MEIDRTKAHIGCRQDDGWEEQRTRLVSGKDGEAKYYSHDRRCDV